MDTWLLILIVIAGLAIWAGILLLVVFLIKAKLNKARSAQLMPGPKGGIKVPLVAAFSVWKKLPWFAVSRNNAAPMLVLHENDVEYRVIRKKHRSYGDISRVDLRTGVGTVNVILHCHDGWLAFAGNTGNKELATNTLRILDEKGCPLSPKATAFIAEFSGMPEEKMTAAQDST